MHKKIMHIFDSRRNVVLLWQIQNYIKEASIQLS